MVSFETVLEKTGVTVTKTKITTLQINVGYQCDLHCTHCHVGASAAKHEMITKDVIDGCIKFIKTTDKIDVDITGGAPEKSQLLVPFIKELRRLPNVERIIVRTNLVSLNSTLIEVFKSCKVELFGSMPCYTQENVDAQRGVGTFQKSIAALRALNAAGYGREKGLSINLVYNPLGGYLPGSQAELERDYKKALGEQHGVEFNNLVTIANIALGRFKNMLEQKGELENYNELLCNSFNSSNLEKIMCCNTVNVDWKGQVYDCDFNQMLGLGCSELPSAYIGDLKVQDFRGIPVAVGDHCYACTAGAGSSCQGKLS